MKMLSRNVELRWISHSPQANGETDFKPVHSAAY